MIDPPPTPDQLDELTKLAERTDNPGAAERFKRAMRQILADPSGGGEPLELDAAPEDESAPDPCDD